jgi:hypothetical protein
MIGDLPPRPAGSSPAARFHKATYDRIASDRPSDTAGQKVSRTTRGFYLSSPGAAVATNARVRQYAITDALPDDYFEAKAISLFGEADKKVEEDDSDEFPEPVWKLEEASVLIARPYQLRSSPFDGRRVMVEKESLDDLTPTWYFFDYASANYRVKYDITGKEHDEDYLNDHLDDLPSEEQTIIPRFIPLRTNGDDEKQFIQDGVAVVDYISVWNGKTGAERKRKRVPVNNGFTIIAAAICRNTGVEVEGRQITLLALSDGWAWTQAAGA